MLLTKTRFAKSLECPKKLDYAKDSRYVSSADQDEFLESLAEGGQKVGAYARLLNKGGVLVDCSSEEEQIKLTKSLLSEADAVIFEGTIRFENLLVRCDILKKSGKTLKLIEVKAKGFDATKDYFLPKKNTGSPVLADWEPYLYDVAYQTYVLRRALPHLQISPYLLLLNKNARSRIPLGGLITTSVAGRRVGVQLDSTLGAKALDELLHLVDVAAPVEKLLAHPISWLNAGQSFGEFVGEVSSNLAASTGFPIVVGSQCKDCEYYLDPAKAGAGQLSGWGECISTIEKGATPARSETIFVLTGLRATRIDEMVKKRELRINALPESEFPHTDTIAGKISQDQRRYLQWREVRGNLVAPVILQKEFDETVARWQWPLHFVDFETSRPALPYHAGRTPYDQILFQFSHHVLERDGRLTHRSEFIEASAGVPPSIPTLKALKNALSADSGTVVHWYPHEQTVLKEMRSQIELDRPADADELNTFIAEMVGVDKKPGRMFDLGRLIENLAFFPCTTGKSSIKRVLPAAISWSAKLRDQYRRPVYGTAEMPSLNFSSWMWVIEKDGKLQDPYALLDPLFSDVDLDNEIRNGTKDDEGPASFVANGGAAIVAYDQLQNPRLLSGDRDRLTKQLLRYCELDTLAMVMVYQAITWNSPEAH